MLDQVLSTTRDIVPLKVDEDTVTFASPFEGEVAKHYFDKTIENESERNIDGFKGHWKYNTNTGLIEGSSTNHMVRLSTKTRPDGIWIPTIQEALILDNKGKLTNNVYRDLGAVVYSNEDPNKKVASELKQAFDGKLPLITSFRHLDYRIDNKFPNGIAITLSGYKEGIISGQEATEYLADNNFYTGGSIGACRVSRNGDGDWNAYWNRFGYSDGAGRVDWMVTEGPCADIEAAYAGKNGVLERQYSAKIKKLKTESDQREKSFRDSLK